MYVVVIEQKSGALDKSADGLFKRYSDGRKNVASQIHRTLDAIRDQFKRQSGHDIVLDYLIYCPDYRLRDLNAVGLIASRIVDARDVSRLADRITSILAPFRNGMGSGYARILSRLNERTSGLLQGAVSLRSSTPFLIANISLSHSKQRLGRKHTLRSSC